MVPVIDAATSHSTHKRHVNDLIYESLHEHVETESIAFFCECGSAHCFEPVWLTGADYATGRRRRGWSPRAPGHH